MENATTTVSLRPRVQALLDHLNSGLYEREEAISLALLSALAGESIFLLGPPGVAKSMIARRLKYAFQGGQSFEYLMNRFSTPDEVFGPVSISRLRLEDKYERKTERYLPGAQIVFLDEIWKAGPAIQNALLTVINEKVYRNGEQEVGVELRGLIAASNELPDKGQGLEALWDRFLVRLKVENIREEQNFFHMITSNGHPEKDPVPEDLKITREELREWSEEIDRVEVPEPVLGILSRIRSKVGELATGEGRETGVSDRRWKKIVRLLRTAAFTQGREKVETADCYLVPVCLWDNPALIDECNKLVDMVVGEMTINLNVPPFYDEKRRLDRKISQMTTRIKQITELQPKLHELPDGFRYYLLHLPDGTSYYLREEDFNRLEFDLAVPADLTYAYKNDYRIFPSAMVRRTRIPLTLIVGEALGKLDAGETTREVREQIRPEEPVVNMLREELQNFLQKVEGAVMVVEEMRGNMAGFIEEHPYVNERPAMWEPFLQTISVLNEIKLRTEKLGMSLLAPSAE